MQYFNFVGRSPFIRMIRNVIPYRRTCDYFSNTSFAQSHAVPRRRGKRETRIGECRIPRRRDPPCANEKEGRRFATGTGRKLVSFVKFFERKVPRSPSVIFLTLAGSRGLPSPGVAGRIGTCRDRLAREFTTKVLLARVLPRPPIHRLTGIVV